LTAAQGDVTSLQGTVGSLQGAMADALAYDDTTHASVTLGGATASAPVALRNVASGELSATSTEAVNGSQLYATNQQVSTNTTSITNLGGRVTTVEGDVTNLDGRVTTVEGDVTNLDGRVTTVEGSVTSLTNQMNTGTVGLVQQAAAGAALTVGKDTDGTSVDFADKDGNARTLTSIGAGTADTDAVNVSQLKSSLASAGLVDDDGNAVAAVTYDKNADGTPNHGSVTMGGGKASGPVAIKNVAAGVDDTDAVNVSQLKATGLVDGSGNAMDAVVYDAGSNRGMITLGGAGALAPVTLTNVANGKSMYDAVNFGQLSSLQSDLLSQISTVSDQVVNVGNQVADIDSRVTSIESGDTGLGGSLSYLDSNAASDAPHGNADAGDSAGLALGYDSVATGENASAIGQGAQALGSNGLAVGSGAYAAGPNDTAIGGNAKVNADHGTALGANSSVAANATNAVAVGAESQVNASSGTAIGQGASVAASATNAVAIGAGSQATQANSVSVGSAGNERVITNVAAGVNATDAVNVSQLQSTQDWARNYMDHATGALNNRINNVGRDAAAGTAAAIATANIPQAYAPNQGSVGAGVGTFNGQTAVAVGMSTVTPSGRWVLKANLTGNNRGDVGAGFGAAMVW
ncbi:YadA-like family protein, partial [Rhodanobacter sp. PCA2]|uniref:YadA family autotransporter adhesin n=1 Tax=Rhodanobacter sp. PCA2 TaxID=2006117 RepID=UPI0015E7AB08